MYFALPALVLVLVYAGQELNLRKKRGLAMSSWRELSGLVFQKKKSPIYSSLPRAREFYLFSFAFICGALFGFWECFLWFLFGKSGQPLFATMGLGLIALMILRRRQKQRPLGMEPRPYRELIAVWVGFMLALQPIFTMLIFTPWVAWRARFKSSSRLG